MATRIPRLGSLLPRNSIQSRHANARCGFSSLQSIHQRGATPVRSISASRNNPFYYERNRPQMRGLSIPARAIHKLPGATTRDMAELEDRVWSAVGATVQDPEIDVDLKTLGWMNRRLAISEDTTVQILLTLPTLLHPSLDELKNLVKSAAEHEIRLWSSEKGLDAEIKVNVEAIASRPVPWMAKDAEDQKDIESRLGPGLANVAHILAVYSCKVRTV
jgi:metal-sulfur cluster biosynthetic enzyme